MFRMMCVLVCFIWTGCGEKAEKEESSTEEVGKQTVGEKCGKPEDCAVGLTCGPDFKCFDPRKAGPSATGGISPAESSGVQSRISGKQRPTVDLGELKVNLKDPAGGKLLTTKLQLELDSEDSRAEVEQRVGAIRYALTRLLSEQKSSDCQGQKQMESLRKQMLRRANSRLNKARIKEVWPTEWIVD